MNAVDEARLELSFIVEGLRAFASLGDFTTRSVSELTNVLQPADLLKATEWTQRCEAVMTELENIANEMDGLGRDLSER